MRIRLANFAFVSSVAISLPYNFRELDKNAFFLLKYGGGSLDQVLCQSR